MSKKDLGETTVPVQQCWLASVSSTQTKDTGEEGVSVKELPWGHVCRAFS